MAEQYIPHLAVPLQVINGQFVTVEQDTDDEVAQCVRNICAFERGFRIEDPDFGINDPTFTTMPIDTEDISTALETYEDRAQVDIYQEIAPDGTVNVRLEVTIPTSEDSSDENVSLSGTGGGSGGA
jgi:phage baseplate assembly protein W